MGRSARSKAGIKVRQPLPRVSVKLRSLEEAPLLEQISAQIMDELNVKKVDILEGFPTFYWRDQFNIDTEDRRHLCWVYYLQHQKAKNMHLPEVANF